MSSRTYLTLLALVAASVGWPVVVSVGGGTMTFIFRSVSPQSGMEVHPAAAVAALGALGCGMTRQRYWAMLVGIPLYALSGAASVGAVLGATLAGTAVAAASAFAAPVLQSLAFVVWLNRDNFD